LILQYQLPTPKLSPPQRRALHADAASPAVTLKLQDVHAAIDVIGRLFGRYYSLFTASTMLQLAPVFQDDWKAVFREPWSRPTDD